MCHHKRVVFACGHYKWLEASMKCNIEQDFDRGKTLQGCSVMWSHGRFTLRVNVDCTKCHKKAALLNSKLATVKERINNLKE
ncbi:hypothetical protein B0T17DRAFT_462184, partial [Bombardia bombarda]